MFGSRKFETPQAWSDEIFRLISKAFHSEKIEDESIRTLLAIAIIEVDPAARVARVVAIEASTGDRPTEIRCVLTPDHKAILSCNDEEVRAFDLRTDKPKAVAAMFSAWVAQEFFDAMEEYQRSAEGLP